jgi:hypothetical protein
VPQGLYPGRGIIADETAKTGDDHTVMVKKQFIYIPCLIHTYRLVHAIALCLSVLVVKNFLIFSLLK